MKSEKKSKKIKPVKTEVLFGFHSVFEAVKARRRELFDLFYTKDKAFSRFERMLSLDPERDVMLQALKKLQKIHPAQLESIACTDLHQGIGARVSRYPLVQISDILDSAKDSPFLVMLDNMVDTHNMGALIRTALCAGVNGVIIPKDRSALPTPAMSKASAGAMEHIMMAQVTNLVNTIKTLKKNKIWVAGLDRHGEKTVFEHDLSDPIVIVVGGEEKGSRPLVRKHCDFLMAIPQKGLFDSLNASVAGAVTMYEAFRQREK